MRITYDENEDLVYCGCSAILLIAYGFHQFNIYESKNSPAFIVEKESFSCRLSLEFDINLVEILLIDHL